MSVVDYDSLLQKLERASNGGNRHLELDDDPFPSSSSSLPPRCADAFSINNRHTTRAVPAFHDPLLGSYQTDAWGMPLSSPGWGTAQMAAPSTWASSPHPSFQQLDIGSSDHYSPTTKLRSDNLRPLTSNHDSFTFQQSALSAGPRHLPSSSTLPSPHTWPSHLNANNPQQQYPSPQGSNAPLNPARDAPEHSTLEPAAPAIVANGAQHMDPSRKSSGLEDDFGDDDAWIDSAIAEMNDAQAAGKPEPPQRRTSPYFHNNPAEPQPPAKMRSECLPQSRTTSAAQVRFPKLGPLPQPRRPTPSPVANLPTPPVELPTPVETPDPRAPSRFVKEGSVSRVLVHALDTEDERALFTFKEFNEMQSTIFHTAYKTDENMVVAAPTGSGKTTVFELAFLRMLQFKSEAFIPLAIYMGPTKALCSERVNDWTNRFKAMGVVCSELTGDTEMYNLHKYTEKVDLIVTTPEKWDSVTRRSYMSRIQSRLCLMMIDEVHALNEERGATLEVVVSRMKKRGDALRFVAVSATVPNIDDVAGWIGNKQHPKTSQTSNHSGDGDEPIPPPEYDGIEQMPKALVFKFGDEFRPVPLKLHAMGTDAPNEFALSGKLDKELFPVLNRYSDGLPTLVFCPTRKACQATAEHLYKEYQNAVVNRTRLPWDSSDKHVPTVQRVQLKDPKIQKWTELGIAVHHAGLDLLDRRNIEQAFRNSKIHLLVATSTLAVGVNLPAHLVVIKGTSCWAGQDFREYSDIDIRQMMGRAGRPQFDTSGTVVIMCNKTKLHKYQVMMNSKTILESCLHQHLTEHINSEIALGNISSLQNAQDWLRGTFLSIRIRQNPKHYKGAMVKDHTRSWDATLDRFVENAVRDLKKHEFVTDHEEVIKEQSEDDHNSKELRPTSMGKVMSQNFISYRTMCHIISMDQNSGMRELLEILAGATEFSRLRIRQGEGALFNKLRISPDIRFNLDTAKTYADKVFLLLQVAFGNVNLDEFSTKTENTSPLQTQMTIFNAAPRIARAIFAVACHKKFGGAALAALELCHTVNGKAWEDSATIFRQIDKIGPKSITVLASNGITTFDDLIKLDDGRLEMWLNRHPPFGFDVIEQAKAFPRFTIKFFEEDSAQDENGFPTILIRLQINSTGQLTQKVTKGGSRSNGQKRAVTYNLIILTLSTKDNRFLDFRSINTAKLNDRVREFTIETTLYDPDETIVCVAGVEEKSGLARTFEYKPNIPADQFPKRDDVVPRLNATQAGQRSERMASPVRPSNPPRRSKSPLVLPNEVSDIEEISDDEELIDLTAPQRKKSKKRSEPTRKVPAPKKRKLALAVKSFIDYEAIDDEEEDEEEYPDDNGFIDIGDREAPKSSRPSKSSRTAGRSETREARGSGLKTAISSDSDRRESSNSANTSRPSAKGGRKSSTSPPLGHPTEGERRTTKSRPDYNGAGSKATPVDLTSDLTTPGLEDIPGHDATPSMTPSTAPEPSGHTEDAQQTVEDQFQDWFGEYFQ